METLYNLTKADAKTLLNYCEDNIESLALLLWNKGKVKTLESGVKRAKKIKNFANENNNNNKLKDNINIIIDEFTTKYGKILAAHPHIKRVENDILCKLAQDIDKYLMFNYGNDTSYRKILNIIDDFTSGDALFNDNNTTLAENILKEFSM